MQTTRRRFLKLAAVGATALASGARADTLPTVRIVGAAPVIRPDLAYQYLGIPMGYYQKLGFTGDFLTVAGSATALQLVLAGSAEIANVGFLELISAKQRQSDLPIRMVFCQERVSSYQIVVPPDSEVRSMADLKGKAIGVPSLASGTVPLTKGMLMQVGIDPKTVPLLPVGTGAQALAALRSKQVDAISTHIGQISAMELLGQEFRYFVAPMPAGGFVMADSFIKKNRTLAVAILQGLILNQQIMLKDPTAVVRAYWKQYGAPTGDVSKAMKEASHYIERTAGTFQKFDDPRLWGDYTPKEWDDLNAFLGSDGGLIPKGALLEQFYTRELIVDANKVDKSLAEAAIKAFST